MSPIETLGYFLGMFAMFSLMDLVLRKKIDWKTNLIAPAIVCAILLICFGIKPSH